MSIGLPVKILRESESHVVTIELKTGDQFRGYLAESEDTMNVRLDNVTMINRNGKQSQLQSVYLRGAQIRFIVIPDFFKNAPMFKRIKAQSKNKNKSAIREKARKIRDQVIGQKQQKK
ncbi:small nuclear ribonucleoprotein (macronuclear) [Tetrahymena thermophila SB210]|uniref:Small nuclear ribonucleoprotein Sm D3 n=1 Tax=Tetrahymena thermophila (strain SB210) TaxID=312017 RepID=W7XEA1_TETTS|nr:small nuclear ribonucleoprotein [Tetrahymena thermophila SB210]EWS71204.1 small nuclear ribonucleoprotein [Tetrahymena thermophila SB210]|eukprot:XP_012656257.1 small nuclear ribonucleoprotein [Tetrahymena thermophila SB210]